MTQPRDAGANGARPSKPQRIRPDERPEMTPERNVESGVRDTFPASDPTASTNVQGARAVPPQRMMRGEGDAAPQDSAGGEETVTLTARFADQEAAKLAVEALVRDVPIDRNRAALQDAEGPAVLVTVHATQQEAERVKAMLQRAGGSRSAAPHGP